MNSLRDVAVHRSRLRRLRLLQSLYHAYPNIAGEGLLLNLAKDDPELAPNRDLVRRSLQYLADLGLAEIITREGPDGEDVWTARITPAGVDYLEGDDPGLPGVRHPAEFLRGRR